MTFDPSEYIKGLQQLLISDKKNVAFLFGARISSREFDRLYDPSHPVRNNLETLDSVEVVRNIREALKK